MIGLRKSSCGAATSLLLTLPKQSSDEGGGRQSSGKEGAEETGALCRLVNFSAGVAA